MQYVTKILQANIEDEPANINVKHYFFIHSEWTTDVLKIKLRDSKTDKCFNGEAFIGSPEVADELGLDFNSYLQECKEALTTKIGAPGFTYKIDYDENKFQVFKQDKFETQYLNISLKVSKNEFELFDTIVEMLNVATQDLPVTSTIQVVNSEEMQMKEEFDSLEAEIEKVKKREAVLMKKFAIMLKEKNSEIQKLIKINEQLKKDIAAYDDEEIYLAATLPMTPPNANIDKNTRQR